MYKCDECGSTSEPGEKLNIIQVMRTKTYNNVKYEYDEKTKRKTKTEFETQGNEAASEIRICKNCPGF